MSYRVFLSFLIWVAISPLMLLAWPCLACMLRTDWDGRTYFFGNQKWGRATTHPSAPTTGYWSQLLWMGWRNPVNNLMSRTLGVTLRGYTHQGDANVGDKIAGGFYSIEMGYFWEYYWVKPYVVFGQRRCVRARVGWKIYQSTIPEKCAFVFSFNPCKPYSGV